MLISSVFVRGHSLYLFDISLDFDQELKSNTIKAAQSYAKTVKEPLAFDLDNGLIIVHFEPEQRNYVEVNPLGYKVQGMRNENLKHKAVTAKLTKEQGFEIAKKLFETLPGDVESELRYSEVSEVDDTYFYKWLRYTDGILVIGEEFMVNVDAVNGNIIAWRLSIFDYPKNSILTTPAISGNVAKKVAELSFNSVSADNFEPYLVIIGNEPVWVTKLQGQFYPFYIGVSGKDGSLSFTGVLPGYVPNSYKTENIRIAETDLIRQIYNLK